VLMTPRFSKPAPDSEVYIRPGAGEAVSGAVNGLNSSRDLMEAEVTRHPMHGAAQGRAWGRSVSMASEGSYAGHRTVVIRAFWRRQCSAKARSNS